LNATFVPNEPRSPEDLRAHTLPGSLLPSEEAWRRFDALVAPALAAHGYTPTDVPMRLFSLHGDPHGTSLGFSVVRDKRQDARFAGRVRAWLLIGIREVEEAIRKVNVPIGRLLRSPCSELRIADRAIEDRTPSIRAASLRLRAGWSLCHDRCIELEGDAFA